MKIELGSKVKDVVSGFEGIATGRAEYITGCAQYLVSPQTTDKEGKLLEAHWFDETRLQVKAAPSKAVRAISQAAVPERGGPQRDAPRR